MTNAYELSPSIKRNMWQIWHKLLIRLDKDISVDFINHGYDCLNNEEPVDLLATDETNRYCIQLYEHLASQTDLYNKDILETGSGRGGGANYITSYYEPASYLGIDISGKATDFCNQYYNEYGLSFLKRDIAEMHLDKNSFDVVISVESLYGQIKKEKFLKDIYQLLAKEGNLLFADFVEKNESKVFEKEAVNCGFKIKSKQNITPNVLSALLKDYDRRQNLIKEKVPNFLKKAFSEFSGIKGSQNFNSLNYEEKEYWSFVLVKK